MLPDAPHGLQIPDDAAAAAPQAGLLLLDAATPAPEADSVLEERLMVNPTNTDRGTFVVSLYSSGAYGVKQSDQDPHREARRGAGYSAVPRLNDMLRAVVISGLYSSPKAGDCWFGMLPWMIWLQASQRVSSWSLCCASV